MKEDTRICPYCHKYPPTGQVWKDFYAHQQACPKRPKSKEAAKQDEQPLLISAEQLAFARDLFGIKK